MMVPLPFNHHGWSLQVAAHSGSDCSSGIWPSEQSNQTSPGATADALSDSTQEPEPVDAGESPPSEKEPIGPNEVEVEGKAPKNMSMEERCCEGVIRPSHRKQFFAFS